MLQLLLQLLLLLGGQDALQPIDLRHDVHHEGRLGVHLLGRKALARLSKSVLLVLLVLYCQHAVLNKILLTLLTLLLLLSLHH